MDVDDDDNADDEISIISNDYSNIKMVHYEYVHVSDHHHHHDDDHSSPFFLVFY